jgi:hypothetical protein
MLGHDLDGSKSCKLQLMAGSIHVLAGMQTNTLGGSTEYIIIVNRPINLWIPVVADAIRIFRIVKPKSARILESPAFSMGGQCK